MLKKTINDNSNCRNTVSTGEAAGGTSDAPVTTAPGASAAYSTGAPAKLGEANVISGSCSLSEL